jgi:hypothetical protein
MTHRTLLATLFSLLLTLPTSAADLTLAEAGVAKLPIVLSPAASESTRAVAKDLADHLNRITGATFEITTTPADAAILLGTLEQFPDPALTKPLEIRDRFDGREAYAIRTDANRLRLIGATDVGASHAAYRLLEHVGCRWFFPAPEWHVVPSSPTLNVFVDETDRPTILSRRIWYGWGTFTDKAHPRRAQSDYESWARRNRMAASLPVSAGHAWQDIIHDNKQLFAQHPEYLALTAGKRQGEQLCVSNPAIRQLAVDHVLKQFDRRPTLEMASIECSDGGGHCECDDCKKLGSHSNQVFGLANHVAKAVAAKYPGRMVGVLAYNEHSEPPTFDLEPNVYVQLTAGFTTGRYTFDELMDEWPKRSRNLGFYDYFSVWPWDFDRLPGGRGGDVSYLQKQIKRYADRRATSVDAESGNNWGPHGRGYYLANRLMWNPAADPAPILADFYDKAFGPAAKAVQRYYERVDPGNHPLMSRHLLALAFRDLEEAARLAENRPDVQPRLDHLKQYLRYEHLCWLRDRETDPEAKKAAALAVITHAYRTRFTYMTHWEAMRQAGTDKYAKQFKEPSWHHAFKRESKDTPAPWQNDNPIAPDETQANFAEGLAYFTPQPIEERTFSNDLIPANLTDPTPAPTAHHYQGGLRYALYSRTGEDLALDVTPGTIAWYRNRADARYTLRASDGETTITQARLPLDGKPHRLTLKVPQPGLYWFDFDDSAAGWRIAADPARPVTIPLRRDRAASHQGHMPRTWFYVPKGTKQIHYYWSGGPHQVAGPDGKPLAQVKTTGEFVTIPVPPGADGHPWSLTQLALGHLWFFNCPNALAASPSALLLPREVVEQDGLAPSPAP